MADVVLPDGVHVRPLEVPDLDAVVGIETEAFTTPWQKETFAGLIDRDGVELLVMTQENEGVIGYAVLWCILDQGELANLAITPALRRSGLGSHLLRQVMRVAKEGGVEKLFLEVRESNQAAIDLYHRFGFNDVGLRRGYYQNPKEDARVMLVTLQ